MRETFQAAFPGAAAFQFQADSARQPGIPFACRPLWGFCMVFIIGGCGDFAVTFFLQFCHLPGYAGSQGRSLPGPSQSPAGAVRMERDKILTNACSCMARFVVQYSRGTRISRSFPHRPKGTAGVWQSQTMKLPGSFRPCGTMFTQGVNL